MSVRDAAEAMARSTVTPEHHISSPDVRFAFGKITVTPAGNKLTIRLNGSSVDLPDTEKLASYTTAALNDEVRVLIVGSYHLVLGEVLP
jgi:hypothetical protein